MNTYQEEEGSPETVTQPHRGAPLWYIAGALGAVVMMGVGVVVGGGWLGGIQPSLERRVYVTEGEDTATCPEEFEVGNGWELRWVHSGELQEICWTNQEGDTECYTAMHRKPIRYHGSVNVRRGGRYTLRVVGTGKWRLEVYSL